MTTLQPQVLIGDCREQLKTLPDESVQCVITSPPYFGLRDYGVSGQIGLEQTPAAYVQNLVEVFSEVWRVLRPDGVVWLNLGDSYAGSWGNYAPGGIKHQQRPQTETGKRWERKAYSDTTRLPATAKVPGLKPKDLIGIPWRVAFALQDFGYYLRSDIIWSKPNAMPESVTDRPTKAHETIFLLTKQARYYYNATAIREPSIDPIGHSRGGSLARAGNDKFVAALNHKGAPAVSSGYRNKRSVWEVPTSPYSGAHFATFPEKLIEPMVLAGSRPGDTILDPFAGSGTTLRVALRLGRKSIGIELNPDYVKLVEERTDKVQMRMVV